MSKKQPEKEIELMVHYEPNPDAFQMREWEMLRRAIAHHHGLTTRQERVEIEESERRYSEIRPLNRL
jgi:hypothetical protein